MTSRARLGRADRLGPRRLDRRGQHQRRPAGCAELRLHIPLIFGLDVIHGYKTIFRVPLAEASSWDPALVQNDESVSASEATADGIKWTFNPMVDIRA